MKFLLSIIVPLSLLFPTYALGKAPSQLTALLSKNVANIISKNDTTKRQKTALELFDKYFGFDEFAMLTLHDHWNALTIPQQERFKTLFKENIKQALIDSLSKPSQKNISLKIMSERRSGRYTEVKCRVFHNNEETLVSFVWAPSNNGWHLIDFSASKASLVANYQGQFNKIIDDHGFDGLLQRIAKHSIQNNP